MKKLIISAIILLLLAGIGFTQQEEQGILELIAEIPIEEETKEIVIDKLKLPVSKFKDLGIKGKLFKEYKASDVPIELPYPRIIITEDKRIKFIDTQGRVIKEIHKVVSDKRGLDIKVSPCGKYVQVWKVKIVNRQERDVDKAVEIEYSFYDEEGNLLREESLPLYEAKTKRLGVTFLNNGKYLIIREINGEYFYDIYEKNKLIKSIEFKKLGINYDARKITYWGRASQDCKYLILMAQAVKKEVKPLPKEIKDLDPYSYEYEKKYREKLRKITREALEIWKRMNKEGKPDGQQKYFEYIGKETEKLREERWKQEAEYREKIKEFYEKNPKKIYDRIFIVDLEKEKVVFDRVFLRHGALDTLLSPDNRFLALATEADVSVIDVKKGELICKKEVMICDGKFSTDSRYFVGISGMGRYILYIFDTLTGKVYEKSIGKEEEEYIISISDVFANSNFVAVIIGEDDYRPEPPVTNYYLMLFPADKFEKSYKIYLGKDVLCSVWLDKNRICKLGSKSEIFGDSTNKLNIFFKDGLKIYKVNLPKE
jgi:hypothetical protein